MASALHLRRCEPLRGIPVSSTVGLMPIGTFTFISGAQLQWPARRLTKLCWRSLPVRAFVAVVL